MNSYDHQIDDMMDQLEAQVEALTGPTAPMFFVENFHQHLLTLGVSSEEAAMMAVNCKVDIRGLDVNLPEDMKKIEYFAERFAHVAYKAITSKAYDNMSSVARQNGLKGLSFTYKI